MVLARLMESEIWYLTASNVDLCGEGSEKGQWPLPAFLSGRKLSPSSLMPDTSSLYGTGAFQAATPRE